MTQLYGPAVRCKRLSSTLVDAVLHYCIRPLIGAPAPGHHGYQRAYDLILRQASNGLVGSPVFARAGKTDLHCRLILSQTSAGNSREARSSIISLLHAVPLFVPGGRSFVPACGCTGAPRARAVKAGRRDRLATCASVSRPRLDGPEHGATMKQIGALLHWS